eukprot:6803311-Pyramimonas_sp.AAC.1
MFAGKLYKCVALTQTNEDIYGDYQLFYDVDIAPNGRAIGLLDRDECVCEFCEWKSEYLNFDNVGQGMLTLFAVSTTDQWIRCAHPPGATR